jgi:hypothetical protein
VAKCDCVLDKFSKKAGKFGWRHLARSLLEIAMSDFAMSHRMTDNPCVEGRIGEHHLGDITVQQTFIRATLKGVAAEQVVPAEFPEIAWFGNCGAVERKATDVIGGICGLVRGPPVENEIDLSRRKSAQLDIKIDIDQVHEMLAQEIEVPDCLLGKTVIGCSCS